MKIKIKIKVKINKNKINVFLFEVCIFLDNRKVIKKGDCGVLWELKIRFD